jgi:Rrf2 family cysteine metabolism transcriptional repressor
MRDLNAKTRYALLAAIDLAANHPTGKPSKIQEIASRTGAPRNYLVHILLALKRRALVNSSRGAKGGYWLTRPPELISAAQIIGAVERTGHPGTGMRSETPYGRAVSKLWEGLAENRRDFLSRLTLADLLHLAGNMQQLSPGKPAQDPPGHSS